MSDYVQQLQSPRFPHEKREAEQLAASFEADAYVVEGIVRWNSNDAIPPNDILALWQHLAKPFDHAKSVSASQAETAAFLEAYRKANTGRPRTEEELAEMRAAFGPDEEVVDVITGDRMRT